ncbi:glutaminyl-peptide cyclotransferase [Winogradskyella aurantiaca]|uniref:glutaminyl-peptide cyclotransferase n=1 Tax=Winogradskyella aurantiaca TaxID=2219558 RepID=UPI000E1CF3F1|nr:glutaminyl-peptide cyclotransferase [Winogradskyella aurantiaca]
MSSLKPIASVFLLVLICSCASNSVDDSYGMSITTSASKNTITLGETVTLSINNPRAVPIASVQFMLDGEPIEKMVTYSSGKLGNRILKAVVKHSDTETTLEGAIKVLNNEEPAIYTYEIVNTYPHDITSYTQGLEFYNGQLYESTGQYKESKLRKVDYTSGTVLKNTDLADGYFGEGLTVLNENIYQLTWQEDTGLIYDVNTFEPKGMFRYDLSKEGWGLCNDGTSLYKSDGTEKIWTLNTDTLTEDNSIDVFTNKGKIPSLNELEWVNGKIYANIYQRNGVAIINPETGAVEGVIDFTPLKELVTQHDGLDVLNGIAYNPDTNTIFVTGKRWDKLFEVTIAKKE